MERAGRGIAERLVALGERSPGSGEVVVLCGPGNNGGDGLVVARLLHARGIPVRAVVGEAARYSDDFVTNAHLLIDAGGRVGVFGPAGAPAAWGGTPVSESEVQGAIAAASILVDALLGTGQQAAPSGAIGALVKMASHAPSGCAAVAIDLPTGVNGESGAVYSPSIRADHTCAIQYIKRGLMQYPARERCGEISVVDIGIRPSSPPQFFLLGDEAAVLPGRKVAAHKGDFGHVTVVGGSSSMPGAPMLVATAALRMGAGWVSLARPGGAVAIPEVMVVSGVGNGGSFEERDAPLVIEAIRRSRAVVIGPGMGRSQGIDLFLRAVLSEKSPNSRCLVVDADALHSIAGHPEIHREFVGRHVVLTPHPGEAARLLGWTSDEVQADRFRAVVELSLRYNATVVLKGAGTLVCGDGRGYVCPFGTPYLATPGSGDVLAGMIGALGAQGFDPIEAACRGVVIHARSGEVAHRHRGGYLIASDIIEAFGAVIRFR